MLELLSKADLALGNLNGTTAILPDPDLFVFMYVRKEALLSSQIEGTQASLIDILEFESERTESPAPKDVSEVINYISAMNYGLDRLETFPLSLRLIREIHERLLQGVRGGKLRPGEFRTAQNWVGPEGSTLATATYVPPPVPEMKEALHGFEKFLYDESRLPVLIRVGLAHAQFETIHPFLDGNGRVGRLLITFLLCQRKILQKPLLYLSHFIKFHKSEYYDRLQAIRENGDWEGWLKFFLKGVHVVSNQATEKAKQIVEMREQHRKQITKELRNNSGTALTLLEDLYKNPMVTINHISKISRIHPKNASALATRLESIGLLHEITGQRRNRRFLYEPYLELFLDEKAAEISA